MNFEIFSCEYDQKYANSSSYWDTKDGQPQTCKNQTEVNEVLQHIKVTYKFMTTYFNVEEYSETKSASHMMQN